MALVSKTTGEIKVRVKGITSSIRTLAGMNDKVHDAAKSGIYKAAEYLMEKIKGKFGSYQPTGGDNGGAWKKLSYETIARKLRKYGFGGKPLVATGAMRDSFYVVESRSPRALSASVGSSDPKLVHHIFGAPRTNLPKRDPMVVTAEEERDACSDIVRDEINRAILKMGI